MTNLRPGLIEASAGRKRWSMEGRFVVLFVAGTTLLLLAVSVALYGAIRHYLDQRVDPSMSGVIDDAADDLNEPAGIADLTAELAATHESASPYWIRVLDAKHVIATETRGMSQRIPISEFPTAPESGTARRDIDGHGKWISLAVRSTIAHGGAYVIQVAEDRAPDRAFLHELRWMLSAIPIAGIICAGAIAIVLTKRGLRPLKEMEHAVANVRLSNLRYRLDEHCWPRELHPLAVAFNEMMERLEESFERLSQFSADLAHELRTPIANLRGEAEVALTRARSADEYRQVLESSMEEYERLTEMTSRLLFLARADGEEAKANLENIEARPHVNGLLEFYEPLAEEKGIALTGSGDAMLRADPVLLYRALANLIENALRFTPPGGSVEVSVREVGARGGSGLSVMSERLPEDGFEIAVKDTGCGIAEEHLPRIFNRFYQADPSRRKGGSGLGLALVKSIMKLHGGDVTAASKVGAGTVLILYFPA